MAIAIQRMVSARREAIEEDVASDLLRGVRVHKVLDGLGRIWTDSCGATVEENDESFGMSEVVDQIDDFISHDWLTGRWAKFFTLCYFYNGLTALLVCSMTCATLAVLMIGGLLPKPPSFRYPTFVAGQHVDLDKPIFFLPVGLLLFWLALIFGQRARSQRTTFVDKVCISQSDDELKRQGILSLAGILARSSNLVILWTPRYYTRLWCVFEIATWLRIQDFCNLGRSVKFNPISRARLFLLMQLVSGFQLSLLSASLATGFEASKIGALSFLVACLLVAAYLRSVIREVLSLPEQLRTFSIRKAACFCCTNSHKHPVTGSCLPCDRKLIYAALMRWFSNEELVTEDEVLDHFDARVRVQVRRCMVARSGILHVSYVDALIIGLPMTLFQIDRLCALGAGMQTPGLHTSSYLLSIVHWGFLENPVWVKLSVLGFTSALRAIERYAVAEFGCVVSLILALLWFFVSFATKHPIRLAMAASSPYPMWCVTGAFVFLTIWLYRPVPSMMGDAHEITMAQVNTERLAITSRRTHGLSSQKVPSSPHTAATSDVLGSLAVAQGRGELQP